MRKGIVVLLVLAMLLLAACGPSIEVHSMNLYGMSCDACERQIVDLLERLDVEVLSISAADGYVEFEYNSRDISLEVILQVLERNGYTTD